MIVLGSWMIGSCSRSRLGRGLCVLVLVLVGLLVGAVGALAAAPEMPATKAVEVGSVTGVSAVLRGVLNPRAVGDDLEGEEYDFVYAPSEGGECNGGLVAPEPAKSVLGDPGEGVSVLVSGLTPNTEYAFCVVAINTLGGGPESTSGLALSFRTRSVSPVVESVSSVGVRLYEARLEAGVNAENLASSCAFEYASEEARLLAGGGTRVACEGAMIEGFGGQGAGVNLTGLTPGTKYFFRVALENTAHEKNAALAPGEFETAKLEVPGVESETATGITPFEVSLEASVNPDFQETNCKFEYGPGAGLPAATTLVLPCGQSSQALGSAGPGTGVSAGVTGLTPATGYYYRVVLSNRTGESAGSTPIEYFSTLAALAPGVESESAAGVSPFEVSLEAVVNPEYQETSCVFEYSIEKAKVTGHDGTRVPCSQAGLGAGGGGVGASVSVAGLAPATVYYYRVIATNATGKSEGAVESVTTQGLPAPVIESESAPSVLPTQATLEAQIDPGFQASTCEFEYSLEEIKLTEGKGSKKACTQPLGSGGVPVSTVLTLTGLQANKLYYYRVIATNPTGPSEGAIQSFQAQPPLIEFENATGVTQNSAKLEAQLNPETQSTSYQFEYASEEAKLEKDEGTIVAGTPATPLTGAAGVLVTAQLTNVLEPGQIYYYRVMASDATGAAIQPLNAASLRTLSVPVAETKEAEALTPSTATLTAAVNPEGLPTSYVFEYGRTTGYGHQTLPGQTPAATSLLPESAAINGLEPGSTYHYRITASNTNPHANTPQNTSGEDRTFQTPATPPLLTNASVASITPSTATITASLDPQNLATHYELLAGTNPSQLGPQATGDTNTPTTLTLTLTDLAPNTLYYWQLTATSLNGNPTITGTLTTPPAPTPTSPLNQPITPPLLNIPPPPPTKTTPITPPPTKLTNKQKLEKALKTCRKHKNKHTRTTCEAQAHHNNPTKTKNNTKKR
jgi:phosphodiesterase/alkaline phosphatase D-like protein